MRPRPKSRTQVIKALMEIDRYDITDVAVNVCKIQHVLQDTLHLLHSDVSVIRERDSKIRLLEKRIRQLESKEREPA